MPGNGFPSSTQVAQHIYPLYLSLLCRSRNSGSYSGADIQYLLRRAIWPSAQTSGDRISSSVARIFSIDSLSVDPDVS